MLRFASKENIIRMNKESRDKGESYANSVFSRKLFVN